MKHDAQLQIQFAALQHMAPDRDETQSCFHSNLEVMLRAPFGIEHLLFVVVCSGRGWQAEFSVDHSNVRTKDSLVGTMIALNAAASSFHSDPVSEVQNTEAARGCEYMSASSPKCPDPE